MGHWCRICGRIRGNERFSGKGHKQHICNQCARLPRKDRQRVDEEREIVGMLSQSNISKKNLARLRKLAARQDGEIAEKAKLVLEVGKAHPYKRKRLRYLARERRDLLETLKASGLIEACW